MTETVWSRNSAYVDHLRPGHYGASGRDGLVVRERVGLSLVQVLVAPADEARAALAFTVSFGLTVPGRARSSVGESLRLSWMGPGTWLALGAPGLHRKLAQAIGHLAALVDQSDGRGVLRLSGPQVREVLAKGIQIDLHPRGFRAGDTALTTLAHGAAQLWQVDDEPTFDLITPRAVSGDIWHWLSHAGAEFGIKVEEPLDGFRRG